MEKEKMMNKYVLFGAGQNAKAAIKIIGKENINYLVDNDINKDGIKIDGLVVIYYHKIKEKLLNTEIVITVSDKYYTDIENQLINDGFSNYLPLKEIKTKITKEKIENCPDYIKIYNKANEWIKRNTLDEGSIICNTGLRKGYPEVTGYYIPTLIRWGYRELAIKYANWLLSIQKEDGSWYDTQNKSPYVFDSAQVLKGLIAVRKVLKNTTRIDHAITRGCDWILSRINMDGRLITPSTEYWGKDENICSEIVHLYCLSPIKMAGEIFERRDYIKTTEKSFDYYRKNYYGKIMNFSLLSHFYAYLMEALLDLGYVKMCREAMEKIAIKQKSSGAVPAYNNVDWVCSTGIFQLSIVWFRLGEIDRGNRAFEYACKLQNESGGWFGSYLSEDNADEENTYFPSVEISWANKYFLDALYFKSKAEMNMWASGFKCLISHDDERYTVVKEQIKDSKLRVLDAGCGKGRYLRNLIIDLPDNEYFGIDISSEVLKYLKNLQVETREGTLTNIPYEDNHFEVVYACEALEHAIDIENAICEMARVTKDNGVIIVIDKNDTCIGALDITEWEQWFNEDILKKMLLKYCSKVEVRHGLRYENMGEPALFSAWIGRINKNA